MEKRAGNSVHDERNAMVATRITSEIELDGRNRQASRLGGAALLVSDIRTNLYFDYRVYLGGEAAFVRLQVDR